MSLSHIEASSLLHPKKIPRIRRNSAIKTVLSVSELSFDPYSINPRQKVQRLRTVIFRDQNILVICHNVD